MIFNSSSNLSPKNKALVIQSIIRALLGAVFILLSKAILACSVAVPAAAINLSGQPFVTTITEFSGISPLNIMLFSSPTLTGTRMMVSVSYFTIPRGYDLVTSRKLFAVNLMPESCSTILL